jgi:hypothetical protein
MAWTKFLACRFLWFHGQYYERLSKFYIIYNGSNLTVFDEILNDNEIV